MLQKLKNPNILRHFMIHTKPIRSNITESKPQLYLGFTFGYYSGFPPTLQEWSQINNKLMIDKQKVNSKQSGHEE